jgi:hypothetical protein
MDQAMPQTLTFSLAPERLDEGSAEERAVFGLFTVHSGQGFLTEGFDYFLNGYRPGPLVSGYHAAEWLAWNWWRLRWEPRDSSRPDWLSAHRMTSIGQGYLWPILTIFSDGVRTAIFSSASPEPDARPFRFMGAFPLVLPSQVFEQAVDDFMPQVIGRLRGESVEETNLDRIWRDVLRERCDPELARRRRFEALLGREPDDGEDGAIEQLVADAERLGEASMDEVAAEAARSNDVPTAEHLEAIAHERGGETSPRDRVRLFNAVLDRRPDKPAWRLGADLARTLRAQERLGDGPIPNATLARLAGTQEMSLVNGGGGGAPFPFVLDRNAHYASLVLRSRWLTGRRFELARLIGDNLLSVPGALHPATRALTYRQKAQRSFAAEFLAPFNAVDEMLAGDYSIERQQELAEDFGVSPMVIEMLLKNHRRIDHDESDFSLEVWTA